MPASAMVRTPDTQSYARRKMSHLAILAMLTIIAALLFVITLVLNDSRELGDVDLGVMATFALNATLGLVFLAKSVADKPFSFVQMHWFFFITMFVIAPISQYVNSYSPWSYALGSVDYLTANIILLVWGLIFAAVTTMRPAPRLTESTHQRDIFGAFPDVSFRAAIVVLIIAAAATFAVVYTVGFANLFSRGTYSTGLDTTLGLLFEKVVRPLPVFAFAVLYIRFRQSGEGAVFLACCAVFMFIADFPIAMSRNSLACLYGGLALLVFDPLRTRRGLFTAFLLVAFLIVFPAGNVYRYTSVDFGDLVGALAESFANISKGFCAVDYDAYSMIARASHYIGLNGATGGFQLLAVVLFFVPRSIWPAKPSGSGSLIATSQGQTLSNISCPLPGEAIINLGYVGVVVFAIAIAIICRKADEAYLRKQGGACVFYPFACLAFFFMMRGDLLSSYAFLCGYFVAFCLLWAIVVVLSPQPCINHPQR